MKDDVLPYLFLAITLVALAYVIGMPSRRIPHSIDGCDARELDWKRPGLYRCLTQENGVRAWIRVEEEY